ncbi:MAG: pseudouridine synthase [Patescibacteria group bacterium]
MVRLNKFLASSGVTSRRGADEMILAGKIRVNGEVVTVLGTQVDPEKDKVEASGRVVAAPKSHVYYLLNKPVGYVTTSDDPEGRKIVTDLVPSEHRVFSVGRLDKNTSGLLLLTNDGDFAYKLTHPKFEKEKEYEVRVTIPNTQYQFSTLEHAFVHGITLEEGIAKADRLRFITHKGRSMIFSLVIHQGWNRQIRRMGEAVGCPVVDLKRIRLGTLLLGKLPTGQYRQLTPQEVAGLVGGL